MAVVFWQSSVHGSPSSHMSVNIVHVMPLQVPLRQLSGTPLTPRSRQVVAPLATPLPQTCELLHVVPDVQSLRSSHWLPFDSHSHVAALQQSPVLGSYGLQVGLLAQLACAVPIDPISAARAVPPRREMNDANDLLMTQLLQTPCLLASRPALGAP